MDKLSRLRLAIDLLAAGGAADIAAALAFVDAQAAPAPNEIVAQSITVKPDGSRVGWVRRGDGTLETINDPPPGGG